MPRQPSVGQEIQRGAAAIVGAFCREAPVENAWKRLSKSDRRRVEAHVCTIIEHTLYMCDSAVTEIVARARAKRERRESLQDGNCRSTTKHESESDSDLPAGAGGS